MGGGPSSFRWGLGEVELGSSLPKGILGSSVKKIRESYFYARPEGEKVSREAERHHGKRYHQKLFQVVMKLLTSRNLGQYLF